MDGIVFCLFLAVGVVAAGFAVYYLVKEEDEKEDVIDSAQKRKDENIPYTKPQVKPLKSKKVKYLENGEQCLNCFKMVPNLVLQPCGHKLLCPDCNFFQLTKEQCLKVCTKSYRCYIYYQKDEEIKQACGDPRCIVCESSKLMVKFDCGHEVLCEDCLIDFKEMGDNKCPEPGCKKTLDKAPNSRDPSLFQTGLVSKNNTSYMTGQFSSTKQVCTVCKSSKLKVKLDCSHKFFCEDCHKDVFNRLCSEPGCKQSSKPLEDPVILMLALCTILWFQRVCEGAIPVVLRCGHVVLYKNLIIDLKLGGLKCPKCKRLISNEHMYQDRGEALIKVWFETQVKQKIFRAIHNFRFFVDDITKWFNTDVKPKLL